MIKYITKQEVYFSWITHGLYKMTYYKTKQNVFYHKQNKSAFYFYELFYDKIFKKTTKQICGIILLLRQHTIQNFLMKVYEIRLVSDGSKI